jgi:predicted ester cyclase
MIDMDKQLEQNKQLVSRLILECFSGGHLHVIDEIVSSEFEFQYPNMPSGLEGLKAIVRKNNDTFTNWSFKIHQSLAEGDQVVVRWSATGGHDKSFLGEPPTNKTVKLKGISIYQIKGGKIYKDWVEPDNLDFLSQLGVLEFIDFTKEKK